MTNEMLSLIEHISNDLSELLTEVQVRDVELSEDTWFMPNPGLIQ